MAGVEEESQSKHKIKYISRRFRWVSDTGIETPVSRLSNFAIKLWEELMIR